VVLLREAEEDSLAANAAMTAVLRELGLLS